MMTRTKQHNRTAAIEYKLRQIRVGVMNMAVASSRAAARLLATAPAGGGFGLTTFSLTQLAHACGL